MRRLIHLLFSPTSRLVRLMLGEKRIACDLSAPDDPCAHLPIFIDLDGPAVAGLWAIIDHLENEYPEHPLLPEDATVRAEALRLFDWAMTNFHEETTKRIVFEKASQAQTGINGAITNVRSDRIIVYTKAKRIAVVIIDPKTMIRFQGKNIKVSELARGDNVTILGHRDREGAFHAQLIRVTRPQRPEPAPGSTR